MALLTNDAGTLVLTNDAGTLDLGTDLVPVGMSPMEVASLVLVAEDTTYPRERVDHYARLMLLQRPQVASPRAPSLFALQAPRPSPTLFGDGFASVYPVIEAFSQVVPIPPPQPSAAIRLFMPSTRLPEPDPEDSTRRLDLGMLHAFRWSPVSSAVFPWTVEIPDLCDDPWREYVHPHPAPDVLAIRHVPATAAPYQWPILFYQSPNLRIEAEADSVNRAASGDITPFRQQQVQQPAGPWVQAVTEGFYAGVKRLVGDQFQLIQLSDIANVTVNYDGTEVINGWMLVLPNQSFTLEQVQSLVVEGQTIATGAPGHRTVY